MTLTAIAPASVLGRVGTPVARKATHNPGSAGPAKGVTVLVTGVPAAAVEASSPAAPVGTDLVRDPTAAAAAGADGSFTPKPCT